MIRTYLHRQMMAHPVFLTLWASMAAFGAYFCMYMYRKPYAAALFEGQMLFGLDYKIVLIISQVAGYACSKFLGIRIISSMKPESRAYYYIGLIGIALTGLSLFYFSNPVWSMLWLFINGLALGLIWGVVFQYLEGRSITELLTVILSANFIFTSGVAKSLGQFCLQSGVSEKMMPMMIGWIFVPLTLLFVWMLTMIPTQNQSDVEQRTERLPMTQVERNAIIKDFGGVLILFILGYIILTMIRDVRDNFGVEIWKGLGYGNDASVYTTSEIPATILILLLLGALYKIKDNKRALLLNLWLTIAGLVLLVLATLAYYSGNLSGMLWMMITGVGLFVPYILYNGILFDRLIGAFKITANVGFFMYIVDAFGYLSSVGILLYKNFGNQSISWLQFYTVLCVIAGIVGVLIMILTHIRIVSLLQKSEHKKSTVSDINLQEKYV
ncbi:MAG: hypothetical protein KA341_15965 [Saprospiraceae bacterium]|nr:hypothetical protein [Saprospiraceae bacterium]